MHQNLLNQNKRRRRKMPNELSFYDVKAKKKFSTGNYSFVVKKGRRFAVAKSPFSGIMAYRIVGK